MRKQILSQMNANLQPSDEPFTIDDAGQHVNDFNAWIDECNAQVRDPLPEDFPMPIDDEQVEAQRQAIEANFLELDENFNPIKPDFDSMSTVDYIKWQDKQRPGTLESYWQAIVRDAQNTLKYARPDDDPTTIENAKAILQYNERRVASC